ncbi:DUF3710 domain-containing protein [Nocardioides jiangxiensis]|uniref:DUF3710 domain-containing protein n=1 Tax=Nocardioides jiangxiensis TaxID=3064524 RepID=A0ABT9B502_9ACTN|nr:DUF3710 domain-containing protein [Nocardioides sp. WY-20]MDO7869475.1 DUF3710 domain-containing protein [Nocardioides sp. WY-20]
MFNKRKKSVAGGESAAPGAVEATPAAQPAPLRPLDISEVDLEDGAPRVDLGGILLTHVEGFEIRMQVDEASGQVQSVIFAAEEGALEVRAFAASRGGDMWDEIRPQIAADAAQRGGTATEAAGRFGAELVCRVPGQLPDGSEVLQETRIVGVDGPRWFVRGTLIGAPVRDDSLRPAYDEALLSMVVRRGAGAMAPGDPLPLSVPNDARRI